MYYEFLAYKASYLCDIHRPYISISNKTGCNRDATKGKTAEGNRVVGVVVFLVVVMVVEVEVVVVVVVAVLLLLVLQLSACPMLVLLLVLLLLKLLLVPLSWPPHLKKKAFPISYSTSALKDMKV